MNLGHRGVIPEAMGSRLASAKYAERGQLQREEDAMYEAPPEAKGTWNDITTAEEEAMAASHTLKSQRKGARALAFAVADALVFGT